MFVVTNKPRLPTNRILTRLELQPYFVEVVSPDSRTPRFETKTEAISYLLGKFGLGPEKTVYFGDTVEDYQSAKTCGVSFIGLQFGYGTFPGMGKEIRLLQSYQELLDDPDILNRLP